MPQEDIRFRIDAGGGNLPGKQEGIAVRGMGMDAGIDSHGFHHGNVRFHLAGGGADARFLARVHVHHADVFHSHEAFGTQGGGAEQQVLSHAHGDVAPVAVHIFPVPQAAPYVAHAFLDDQNFRGMEEFIHFLPRDGVVFFPWEHFVRQGRGD